MAEGLRFPEGPIALPDGSVILVEIAAGTLTRVAADGTKTTVASPGGGPNGIAMGPSGQIFCCNNGGFIWHEVDGKLRPGFQPPDYSGGRIERIDAKTGAKVWEHETEVGTDKKHFFLTGAPLVDAEAVYFGSWDGFLYSLNRKDGTLRWKHHPEVNKHHVGSPITDGKRLYVPIYPNYNYDNQKEEGINGIVAIGDGGE